MIALVVFVFVFAGHSELDRYLPLMETKGAITTLVLGGAYDLGDGEYLVREGEESVFVEHMQKEGWKVRHAEGGRVSFEKDGRNVTYEQSVFLGGFTVYRPVAQQGN